jgi:serine/threonine protein kinase/heme/copper-type cytochrome/quinol oxidase subunit 2
MKNVILAEPSTLALFSLFFMLIFGIVAVCGVVVISLAFLSRKARNEAARAAQPPPSTQATPKNCPKCGAPMPQDSPEGLCPRCLIALNLATQTDIPGEPGAPKVPPGPSAPVAEVAKLFPQLEILECLGRGGMGAVYKVRQPRLDRIVALKILSPEKQGNQKFADRFEREARALAKLHHPNIVTVYDFGEVEGNFYLLMEYVDGMSLRQLLQSRKLSPPEALAIVPKICEALQYAHEQGVVHRDIKPENILMDKEGRVKIADFGIAKILGDGGSSNLTAEQVIGTPHYMSPEQIEKPQTVDHRADIYSLGVVFYEMLTGELPLGKFPPPSKKVQVDVRLDEIVLRALEKEPERRYQQASEVKSRVETISGAIPELEIKSKRMSFAWRAAAIGLLLVGAIVALNLVHSHIARHGATLTEAEFLEKFNSGQIAQATIIMNPMSGGESTVVTITGKYYEAGNEGKPVLENGKPVEDSFTVPNVLLTQSMSEKLLTSQKIDAVIPNPMLSDLGYQLLFLLFIFGIMFLLGTIIFFVQRARRNGAKNTSPEGSGQNSLASFIIAMSRFAAFGAAMLVIIAMVISLYSRSSHRQTKVDLAGGKSVSVPAISNPQTTGLSQVDANILAEQPPVVVETFPVSGARDVAPGDTEIRVRFSKDMMDGGWSWSTAWENSTPESLGPPHYLDDHRTCVVKVHLEPGKTYAWWLNSGKFKGFTDAAGQPSVPYLFSFQTKQTSNAPIENNSFLTPTNHPKVIWVSPADGATDVDPQQDIQIRFDQPMNPNDVEINWRSGGFLTNGEPHYDAAKNEFVVSVRLFAGRTNTVQANWSGFNGFRNTNSISAGMFKWQFATKPLATRPDAPTPRGVQTSPPPGETMPVLTMIELTFDQPMTLDRGLPYLRGLGPVFDVPAMFRTVHYDSSGRHITIPLLLPPDNETRLTLDGFYSAGGAAGEPVVVHCEIGTNNYSSAQLNDITLAAKDPRLTQLLSSMQEARTHLVSGIETVTSTSLSYEKDSMGGITVNPATFKWQGTNQFYEDISDIMGGKAFILGTDGKTCWMYGDDQDNGRWFNSCPAAAVADMYVSIADPFDLARNSVQSAISKGKLIYDGQTQLDGHACYCVKSWFVEQTGNENFRVNAARSEWWIDAETYLPVQVVKDSGYGREIFKFHYEGLNQLLPVAAFQPPATQGSKSQDWFDKKLGPNETFFFKIKDGSDGQMSGRIGRRGPNGSTNSGLN